MVVLSSTPSSLLQQQALSVTSTRLSFSTAVATANNDAEPLLGVGQYKTSTGLVSNVFAVNKDTVDWNPTSLKILYFLTKNKQVGLAVEPDWYNVMLKKFQALLDKMEVSDMPETAQYRMDVTKWCNYVIATAKANPTDPEAVEDAVQMGQVEELIEMADDEMICLDTYLSSRMWELVAAANPPVVDLNPDPMRDPFGSDGNASEQDSIRKGMDQPQK